MRSVFLSIVILLSALICGAAVRYSPLAGSNSISGSGTYCLNASPGAITVSYSTCTAGGGGTASGEIINYTWYSNSSATTTGGTAVLSGTVNTATATTGTLTYTPSAAVAGTKYYYCVFSWTATGSCSSGTETTPGTVSIVVNALPVISAGASVSLCSGNNLTLNATGGTSYSWAPATNLSASTGASVVFSGSATTTYTISGTDANGCTNSTTKAITVNTTPTVTATAGSATICSGATTTLSASGATTYSWSPATGLNTTTSATVTFSGTTGTTYTVTGTSSGCSTTATTSISVLSVPAPGAISGASTVCVGSSTSLTNATAGGTWSSSATGVATVDASGTVYGVSAGSVVITYTVTNICGSGTATKSMTVSSASAVAAISGAAAVNTGSSISLTDATAGGTWSSSNTTIASITSGGVVTGLSAGSVTISYSVVSGCGSFAVTAPVTVTPTATILAGWDVSTLTGGTNSFGTSPLSASTVYSNVTVSTGLTRGSGVSTIGTGAARGWGGTDWISTTQANAITNSDFVTFAVKANTGYAINLSACSISYRRSGTGPASGTLQYSINGSTFSDILALSYPSTLTAGATLASIDLTSVAALQNVSSATTVTFRIVNYGGTNTSGAWYIYDVGASTSPDLFVSGSVVCNGTPGAGSIASASAICGSGSSTLTFTPGSTGTGISYQWASAATNTSTAFSNVSGATSTTYTTPTVSTTTYYRVGTSCSYSNSSATSTTLTQTVNALPAISASAGSSTLCSGTSTTITATGGTSYSWPPATGLSATTGATVTFTGTTTTTYTVTGTNSNGCNNTSTVTITVNGGVPSVPAIGGSGTVCSGTSTTLTNSTAGGTWTSSSNATATVTSSGGVVTGVSTGNVTITYSVSNSCGTTIVTKAMTVNTVPTVDTITGPAAVTISSSITLADATTGGTWSSSNPSIASITSAGVVTGALGGSVNISYTVSNTCGNSIADYTVIVTPVSTVLAGWDVSTSTAFGTSPLTATAIATNVSTPSGLVRASGVSTSGSAATRAWGGTNWTGTSTATAISNGDYLTFDVKANSGYAINISSVSISYRRSNTGPTNGVLQYSTDGTNFTDLSTLSYSSSSTSGVTLSAIDLTSEGDLQNIPAATTVTFRIPNYNGNNNGEWYIYDVGNSTAPDLIINGTVICSGTPSAGTISGATAMCGSGSAALTLSGGSTAYGTSYQWASSLTNTSTSFSNISGANASTYTTATLSQTTYYQVTSSCSYSNLSATTAATAVTINALPSVTTTIGNSSICSGSSTTISASGASTYSWSPSTGLSATTGTTMTASPTTTVTYTVTGTDGNGCINTATRAVTVNTPPSITASGGASTVCRGTTTTLSASGGTSYTWSPATGLSATTGSVVTFSGTVTTTYTVTGTNASGCSSTATRTITVIALPTVSTTAGATAICNGSSTTITAAGASTYSWTPATGISATTGTTVMFSGTATNTYTVTGTDGNGCSSTASRTITVNSIPTVTTTAGAAAICNGASTTITAAGATTYSWTPATGISATTGATVTFSGSATNTYTVTGTSASGCSATATRTITVNALPTVSTTAGATAICNGASTTITATGATTYSWTPATGISATTGATVTFSGTATNTYTVTGTDGNGCSSTASRTITVNALPTVTFTSAPAATICSGTSVAYTTQSGQTSYVWSVSGVGGTDYTITSGGIGSTNNSVTLAWNTTGTKTVTVTYTNGNGCTGTAATASTTVITSPSVGNITGSFYLPKAAITVLANGTAGGSWTTSASGIATINSSTGSMTAVDTGSAIITYTVSNACGSNSDTALITVVQQKWLGGAAGAETNWTNSGNWIGGFIPDSTYDVIIPSSVTYYPSIASSSTQTVKSLTIATGASITINSNATLRLRSNLVNNGSVKGAGTITGDGTALQHISGKGTINNLVLSNAAGITVDSGSLVTIGKSLTISTGTFTTSDSVVLYSDADGTARVGTIGTGGLVSGKIQEQQYIQGNYRRYRMWSHPFNGSVALSQLQNYMDITGTGGSANGFTTTVTNAPSAFRYDPYTSNSTAGYDPGWKPFTSALATAADSNKIPRHKGIRLFIRGTKGQGLSGPYYVPSANTLEMTGIINQGRQVMHMQKGASANQDFNLLGNPYPSPVDIGTVLYNAQQSGNVVGGAFYIFNTSLGSGGQYQAISIGTLAADPYYLQANSAFQVRTAHDGDSLVFNETDKAPDASSYLFKKSTQTTTLNVYDEQYHPWDILNIHFDNNASANEDLKQDALKLSFGDFSFYSVTDDNKQLAIDARPFSDEKAIPLGISSNYLQNFIIRIEQSSVPVGKRLFLHDKLTNNYTEVATGNEYKFSITKNKQSQGDRFELTTNGPADITATSIKVNMVPNPATDNLVVELAQLTSNTADITVTDMMGSVVLSKHIDQVQQGKVELSLAKLASGNYIVEVRSGKDKVTRKLVKD